MLKYAFAGTIFLLILIAFELVYSLFRKPDARSVGSVVTRYTRGIDAEQDIDILYQRKFSDISILNSILKRLPAVRSLDELMQQSGVKTLVGIFILFTFTLGGFVYLLTSSMLAMPFAVLLSLTSMILPFFYLLAKRKERRNKFEALLPDALDLMCYALKAGHSILASFKMVGEELADPIGEEFRRVVDELNYGRDLNATLRSFARRINSVELKFFVTTVIIQRETGGNLVEMLQKISEVIRKKFRFREKVRALSGEAKMSAYILLALPFLVAGALFFINREYILVLVNDPAGHWALATAGVMMSIGTFIMYRLVQLEL